MHLVWFYLFEVQEQSKLRCGERSQNCGDVGKGRGRELLIVKEQREPSEVLGVSCVFV